MSRYQRIYITLLRCFIHDTQSCLQSSRPWAMFVSIHESPHAVIIWVMLVLGLHVPRFAQHVSGHRNLMQRPSCLSKAPCASSDKSPACQPILPLKCRCSCLLPVLSEEHQRKSSLLGLEITPLISLTAPVSVSRDAHVTITER